IDHVLLHPIPFLCGEKRGRRSPKPHVAPIIREKGQKESFSRSSYLDWLKSFLSLTESSPRAGISVSCVGQAVPLTEELVGTITRSPIGPIEFLRRARPNIGHERDVIARPQFINGHDAVKRDQGNAVFSQTESSVRYRCLGVVDHHRMN